MPAESQAQRGYLNARFGHDWVKEHHFDNKGKLPSHVEHAGIPSWAHYRQAVEAGKSCGTCDFFVSGRCEMFDYVAVDKDMVCDRWEGMIEKDQQDDTAAPMYTGRPLPDKPDTHFSLIDLLEALEPSQMGTNTVAKAVVKIETRKRVIKTQAQPTQLRLRVHGMSRMPDGQLSYRMVTRDGHYVGRTNPTKIRAKKGDHLTIQANDFGQDEAGDCHWINPNVIQTYTDSAHSWKEIGAIAGGILSKDGAPGPAGDMPPANDIGDVAAGLRGNGQAGALAAVSGPTMNAVHVDVPLKNISLAYMNRKIRLQVQKADQKKQLIYGVVLEPNSMDSQDDFMLPHHVEKAAHTYMTKVVRGKSSVSKLQHRAQGFFKTKPGVVPVESYIAPVDFSYDGMEMVKKGTWVMVLKVEDENIWDDVLAGKYTGLSIGGTGIRQEMRVPTNVHEYMTEEPTDWFRGSATG